MSSCFSLPLLNPPLEEKDFEKCAKDGECCQCGLCCIAFAIDVPSVPGDPRSPAMRKETGQVCPQMSFDARGRMYCLVHEAKEDSAILEQCLAWRGNVRIETRTYFDALRFTTLMEMLFPCSAEEVVLIAESWRTGRVPPSLMLMAEEFLCEHPDSIMRLVSLYLQHQPAPFPADLFDALDFEGAAMLHAGTLKQQFAQLENAHGGKDTPEGIYYNTHLRRYLQAAT